MHKISKNAIVLYSSKQMFDLINDIKNYPKFLKWCNNSDILTQNDNKIIASIGINKGVFTQQFTTINTLTKNNKIDMKLIDGPFKTLYGSWSLIELEKNSCKIIFEITFSFKSKLMDIALSPTFSQIANSQLDAFINRAKIIYK